MKFHILLPLLVVFSHAVAGSADTRWVWVEQAVDGDTIRLRNGGLVRYLGIDAPEIDHKARKAEPYGYAALALNRSLVEGKRIGLKTGRRKHDRFGRLLAHPVDESGRLINRIILRQGLAYYYPDSDQNARAWKPELLSAQHKAMENGLGIWSEPDFDRGSFIGNRRSLRFHTPTCPYGKNTSIKNRILFSSRRDAHRQGYAPCRRCLDSPIKKGLQHD